MNETTKIRIKYSKNGVSQEQDFYFFNGILQTKDFLPNWSKEKVDVSHIQTEDELLNFVKDFSFTKEAKITHRNGENIEYHYTFDRDIINKYSKEINDVIEKVSKNFALTEILPIIKRKNWFFGNSFWTGRVVLTHIAENGEIDNIDRQDEDNLLIENKIDYFYKSFDYSVDKSYIISNLFSYFTSEQLNSLLENMLVEK